MSHAFRCHDKIVHYNEILSFLHICAEGLLSNPNSILETPDVQWLWETEPKTEERLVQEHYSNLYFFPDEAEWIDRVASNLWAWDVSPSVRGQAFFALTQTCLRKSPFNSFGGSYLKLRLKPRTEEQSWDKPLPEVFKENIRKVQRYLTELNTLQLPSVTLTRYPAASTSPALFLDPELVYLDPPFLAGGKKSRRFGHYVNQYHVLEALAQYHTFEEWIDPLSPLHKPKTCYPPYEFIEPWLNPYKATSELGKVLEAFKDRTVVLSYRSDSHVEGGKIREVLESTFTRVEQFQRPHVYNITTKQARYDDVLFVGR